MRAVVYLMDPMVPYQAYEVHSYEVFPRQFISTWTCYGLSRCGRLVPIWKVPEYIFFTFYRLLLLNADFQRICRFFLSLYLSPSFCNSSIYLNLTYKLPVHISVPWVAVLNCTARHSHTPLTTHISIRMHEINGKRSAPIRSDGLCDPMTAT